MVQHQHGLKLDVISGCTLSCPQVQSSSGDSEQPMAQSHTWFCNATISIDSQYDLTFFSQPRHIILSHNIFKFIPSRAILRCVTKECNSKTEHPTQNRSKCFCGRVETQDWANATPQHLWAWERLAWLWLLASVWLQTDDSSSILILKS